MTKGEFNTTIENPFGTASKHHVMVDAAKLVVSQAGECWTDANDETLLLLQAVQAISPHDTEVVTAITISRAAIDPLIAALKAWQEAKESDNGMGMNH